MSQIDGVDSVREGFIEDLRGLLKFYEDHSDFPVPFSGSLVSFAEDGSSFRRAVRALGEGEKSADMNLLFFRKKFGSIVLTLATNQNQVCKKKSVRYEEVPEQVIPAHTREIVEWDCEPLLREVLWDKE